MSTNLVAKRPLLYEADIKRIISGLKLLLEKTDDKIEKERIINLIEGLS